MRKKPDTQVRTLNLRKKSLKPPKAGNLFWLFTTKDRDDVVNGNHIKLVVVFQIYWDCVLGMEENFVVLAQRQFFIVFDHRTDRDDSPCDGWDLGRVG